MSSLDSSSLLPSSARPSEAPVMSESKTSFRGKRVQMALLVIVGLGLAFLARYQFNEAWNSVHTVVPLAVGGAALIFLAVKVYKQWGVEEWNLEVDGFAANLQTSNNNYSRAPFSYTTKGVWTTEQVAIEGNAIEWVNANVHDDKEQARVTTILQGGLGSCFVIKAQEMLRDRKLAAQNNMAYPNSYNLIRTVSGALHFEITFNKTVRNMDNLEGPNQFVQTIKTLVDIATDHATCTITFTPI